MICTTHLQAQKPVVKNDPNHDKQAIHFGYSLGLNFMDSYIFPYEAGEIENISPGFNVQIVSNFRIANSLDFRILPGLAFGQRKLVLNEFSLPDRTLPEEAEIGIVNEDTTSLMLNMESAYFEVPLLLKYKTDRINNFRPYILAGFNPRVDLSGIQKNIFGGNNEEESEDGTVGSSSGTSDLIKRVAPAYEIGFGIDFYMVYFKLGVEIKYSRSIFDDVNRGGEYSAFFSGVDKLESSVFFISFHFE
ncbi:MAG: outer membrane beta-barrel protein [Bacteroidetes bacterium]|nr:outer membrane beta-barrel protein [Bacteroidota bacterium]